MKVRFSGSSVISALDAVRSGSFTVCFGLATKVRASRGAELADHRARSVKLIFLLLFGVFGRK